MSASVHPVRHIPSIQRIAGDLPRFRVPVALPPQEADAVDAAEATGGVDADVAVKPFEGERVVPDFLIG